MASLRHHVHIAKPADEVWKVVSDPSSVTEWGGVESCTIGDDGARTIAMNGMEITEAIVTNDADLRRFQYAITAGPMVPEYHLATVDVIETGDETLLIYSTEIKPDEAAPIFAGIVKGAAEGIKSYVES